MKVSVFTTTYNKGSCLENTLFSLFMQVTDFPWELRVYDDCSNLDPESIVRKYFPGAFYQRLDEHKPFDEMMSYCLDGDADIIVMMSADVMLTSERALQNIVDNVKDGQAALATVFNAAVKSTAFQKFDAVVKAIWDKAMRQTPRMRSAPALGTWYFFFGGITRKDLKKAKGDRAWCDIMLEKEMRKNGMKIVYPKSTFGIHQDHSQTTMPCTRIDKCTIEPCWLKKRIKG